MRYNDNNRSTAVNGASGNELSNNRLFGTSDNQQAFLCACTLQTVVTWFGTNLLLLN